MSPARIASATLGLAALVGVGLAPAGALGQPAAASAAPAAGSAAPAAGSALPAASAAPAAGSAAPAAGAAPPPAGSATPAVLPKDAIAPPAANASPAKIKEAKEVAKAAALTPILPSPTDATKPAFQLYAQVDLPILGVGAVFAAARLFRTQKAYCAPRCDPAEINGFDRVTAGYWSPAWSTASDVGLIGIIGGATVVLMADEGFFPALNDGLVIIESGLTATAVASIVTLSAGRPRPFLYGDSAPIADRNSSDAGLSFVSNHVAVGAAVVTSTFMAMRRLEPKSKLPALILGLGGAAVAFVSVGRVEAGKHFITDAISGALVGVSIGIIVPALHDSPVKIVPVVGQSQQGLGFAGAF